MKVYRFFKHLGLCVLVASCVLPALGSQTEPLVVHTSVTPSAPEVVAPEPALSVKDIQKHTTDALDAAIAKLKIADTNGDVASIKRIQEKIKDLDQPLVVFELINMPFADETITEIQNKIDQEPQKLGDFLNELMGKEEIQKALQAITLQHAQNYLRTTQERYSNLQKAGAGAELLAVVKQELEDTKERIEELGGTVAEQADNDDEDDEASIASAEKITESTQEEPATVMPEEIEEAEETDVDEVAVTDQKPQDYPSAQDNIRSQQPIYTERGALTSEGHVQRLEQRQEREEAQRMGQ